MATSSTAFLNGNNHNGTNNASSSSSKGSTTNGIPSVDLLFLCMFLIIIVYNNLMQPDFGT